MAIEKDYGMKVPFIETIKDHISISLVTDGKTVHNFNEIRYFIIQIRIRYCFLQ